MDPRRDLRGALRRLVDKAVSIDGTVAVLYQSTADVRPSHSSTMIRSARIQEGLREKLTVGALVRVTRTTQGMTVTEIVGKPEARNLNPLRIRHSPVAPVNFTVSVSSSTVQFRWDVPPGFAGRIRHYEILQADDDTGLASRVFATTTGRSYAVARIKATGLYYAVRAIDIWGQVGKTTNYAAVAYAGATPQVAMTGKPLAVQASWDEYQYADVKYKVDIYREDQEEPIHTAVVDGTTFEYATDVPLLHTAVVTATMPTGGTYASAESDPAIPDVAVSDTIFALADSSGHTQAELEALLDVSWATELVYTGDTWHWIEFATGGKIFDYLTLVMTVPQARIVVAGTYDNATWRFFGLAGHTGQRLDYLGSGPLSSVETHKASYWLAQGVENSRIAVSWPKGFWKKVRVYFYTGSAVGIQELIVDQRMVVGFLEAIYEVVTGGEMVARGEGGSAIHMGYWSHDESDFGIYATDKSGRPFFVLNVPSEYLRIGYPGDKAIVIEDGNITMDGGMLQAHTVKSEALEATTLSAISADLGRITAGEILMGEDEGNGFTGLRMVYPDDEHPGLGVYRGGALQAILSAGGYLQFGQATMDADGIRQPLGPGQWTAFRESGGSAWVAGEAAIFDTTDTLRVFNRLCHETDDNTVDETDSRFSSNPTQWVPMPMYHDSFGVTVSPEEDPTEFFVGDQLMGFRLPEAAAGQFVIADRDPEGAPLPAPLEMDTAQGELVLSRGYGRVLARVPNSFLYVPPASPGTACDLLYQGIAQLCMPAAGWVRRLAVFNNGSTLVTIRIYKNGVEMPQFWPQPVPIPPRRVYRGFRPNPQGHALFGAIDHYPYDIGGEVYTYTVARPNPDAFDFMPADVIRVRAESTSNIPAGLQVWVQFLL